MAIKLPRSVLFVASVWLFSRLLILLGMQVIAPLLPNSLMHGSVIPEIGWDLFSNWDGQWYKRIVTSGYSYTGYEYIDLKNQSSIAFFPLFPLVTRAVMSLGLPFAVAGTIVNNLAFLGALVVLYNWVEERHGVSVAKWSTIVLAWCPLSLFGTVTYTEGLFLLLTTSSLQAFDKRQYVKAAICGAMATATRANGVALIPTFLLVAWRERRPAIAYFVAFATGAGLILFSLYCTLRFADPLAFVHAQKGWQLQTGFNWKVWWNLFTQDLLFRKGWSTAFFAVTKIVTFFGSSYLLWRWRAQIGIVASTYGFCALSLIVISGSSLSIERFIFGIVSVSIALGFLLAYHRKWRYVTIGLFALLLLYYSIRFSWGLAQVDVPNK